MDPSNTGGTQLDVAPVRRLLIALLVACAVLFGLALQFRPLSSPDEVRYGSIAHEMIASGDWVSPKFNGVRYFEKPILGHWLNAVSIAILGETPFALRLPSALATALSAAIVFVLARRYLTRASAWLATIIFLTTALVAGAGTFALLDANLAFFVTAALAAYYIALQEPGRSRAVWYLALCGMACAGAFLAKGFIGLAIPVVVAAPYLVAQRRWHTLLTSPWLPILTAASLVVPWASLIHIREPDFWHYFFWVEHVHRFTAENAQHARPIWYFIASLPLTGWPWVLLTPAALIGLHESSKRHNARNGPFLNYVLAWAVLPLLFLSLSRGKLLTYILPCFAPFSIWLAAGLETYEARGLQTTVRLAAGAVLALLLAAVGIVVAAQVGPMGPVYGGSELHKFALLVATLTTGAICAALVLASRPGLQRMLLFAGPGIALVLAFEFALPQRVLDQVAPAATVASFASAPRDTVLVSDASLFGTVAWAFKRDDIYVVSPGEIEYGLSYPESQHRWLDSTRLRELIADSQGQHEVLILCEDSTEPHISAQLPRTAQRTQHGKVVAWRIPKRLMPGQ
jgi:4-amino-4-deoxy-L-arabinose transferase